MATDRYQKLLNTINQSHDWKAGQTYGGSGTVLRSTDVCRICGLRRNFFSDSQNGVDGEYTFDFEGDDISLRDAAELLC